MQNEARLKTVKIFLYVIAVLSFFWWPLSHWIYPGWYHKILGFAGYEDSYVKIIGTLAFIPVMMMFFSAKNPIKNRDCVIILIISGILTAITYIDLILTNAFPAGEYINVGLTLFLSLSMIILYPWGLKNMKRPNNNKSVQVIYKDIINASVKDVFPLACPVEEYRWVYGWKCELIHCPRGHVEKGCLFKEMMTSPVLRNSFYKKNTWTAVLYNPADYKVHYNIKNDISDSLYKLEFTSLGEKRSECRLEFNYKSINEKGDEVINNHGKEKIYFLLSTTGTMLKYYCETGKMMKASQIIKKAMRFKYFTKADKFKLILNNIGMLLMKDNDKKKFLSNKPVSKVSAES